MREFVTGKSDLNHSKAIQNKTKLTKVLQAERKFQQMINQKEGIKKQGKS